MEQQPALTETGHYCTVETALSSFSPGDVQRGNQLAAAWSNFDDQLTHHHAGEHEIAWPRSP